MITIDQARMLQGKDLIGSGGQSLGKIDALYADRDGGEPTFATINTGMFGAKTSFVPLNDATMQGDSVTVPYDQDLVKAAPSIDPDSELSPEEEQRLYTHYGVGGMNVAQTTATTGTATATTGTAGYDTTRNAADDTLVRSEERLNVGVQQQEVGRARLRKFIVTEQQSVTVPVSHEEVRVVREPITDGTVVGNVGLQEQEAEVVLHAERPVVSKETVAVEKVRLDTQTVTENVQVNEEVRKEQIEQVVDDTNRR